MILRGRTLMRVLGMGEFIDLTRISTVDPQICVLLSMQANYKINRVGIKSGEDLYAVRNSGHCDTTIEPLFAVESVHV